MTGIGNNDCKPDNFLNEKTCLPGQQNLYDQVD